MVTVSILYPRAEGARFDFDYYARTHMPMAIRLLGDAMTAVSVQRGASGTEPGRRRRHGLAGRRACLPCPSVHQFSSRQQAQAL